MITFVMGVFGGSYLYLTGFTYFTSKAGLPDAATVSEFTLVSDIYGSCGESCPSFQVVNDGSYRHLYTQSTGVEPISRQGTLPTNLQRTLGSALEVGELKAQSEPGGVSGCDSDTGGFDVIYEVTLNGVVYVLDSCGTEIKDQSELWLAFNGVWDYLESLRNN